MRTRNAFTLIELLIASAIFSLVALGAYTGFQTGLRTYRKIEAASEEWERARIILNRLEIDFRNSFAYTSTDSGFKGEKSAAVFLAQIDEYSGSQLKPQVCRIQYSASDKRLIRTLYPGTEALKKASEASPRESVYAMDEVSFEYACESVNPDKPYEWQETWPKDDSQKNFLPPAVKVTLSLQEKKNDNAPPLILTKIISLPMGKKPYE